MAGWHHRLNGHDFKQALGIGDGQGSLVCCNPWGRKESDMNERLNWTEFPTNSLPDMPQTLKFAIFASLAQPTIAYFVIRKSI